MHTPHLLRTGSLKARASCLQPVWNPRPLRVGARLCFNLPHSKSNACYIMLMGRVPSLPTVPSP